MLWRYVEAGGVVIWPLMLCSVALGAILLERVWALLTRRRASRSLADRTWHRRVLPFFRDVPPSLGLLGTVIGVVHSFSLMGEPSPTGDAAQGLATACITTIFGLILAIVAAVAGYGLDLLHGVDAPSRDEPAGASPEAPAGSGS